MAQNDPFAECQVGGVGDCSYATGQEHWLEADNGQAHNCAQDVDNCKQFFFLAQFLPLFCVSDFSVGWVHLLKQLDETLHTAIVIRFVRNVCFNPISRFATFFQIVTTVIFIVDGGEILLEEIV